MNLKSQKVQKYWGKEPVDINYSQIDQSIVKLFKGTHPKIMDDFFNKKSNLFIADRNYKTSLKDRKYRIMKKIERLLRVSLSKKHFKLIK